MADSAKAEPSTGTRILAIMIVLLFDTPERERAPRGIAKVSGHQAACKNEECKGRASDTEVPSPRNGHAVTDRSQPGESKHYYLYK